MSKQTQRTVVGDPDGVLAGSFAALADLGVRVVARGDADPNDTGLVLVVVRFDAIARPTVVSSTRAAFAHVPILAVLNAEVDGPSAVREGADYILLGDMCSSALIEGIFLASCRASDERTERRALEAAVVRNVTDQLVGVAHEINNPLQYIFAGLDELVFTLTSEKAQKSEVHEHNEHVQILADMAEGAERIRSITRSFLPVVRRTESEGDNEGADTNQRAPRLTLTDLAKWSAGVSANELRHRTLFSSARESKVVASEPTPIAAVEPRTTITTIPTTTPSPGHQEARLRVLVIDDEEALIRTYRRALKEFDVVTALGGKAALEILANDRSFDAILCDLMMPNVDGPMVYAFIKDADPQLAERILFCSGGAFAPRVRAFLESIPNGVLDKPVSGELLRGSLIKVARSSGG